MEDTMLVVEGFYDGAIVTLNTQVPVRGNIKVSVNFPQYCEIPEETGSRLSAEKKRAILKELAGIASASPLSLDEIKDSRLARQ
jgi:hypothetical protein